MFWPVFLIIHNILKCYTSRNCYENVTEAGFFYMCENAKLSIPGVLLKWYGFLLKHEEPPTVQVLE